MRFIRNGSISPSGNRLPRLIKSLKEEDIDAPIQDTTHSIRPKGLRSRDPRDSTLIIASRRRPPRLTNPKLRRILRRPSNILNMTKSLHDIIKETRRRIRQRLSLPIRERVAKKNVYTSSDQRICCSILVFVPGICGADFEAAADCFLGILDLRKKFRPREVASVESLGSDGYGVHLVGVLGGILNHGGLVCCVTFVGVGPR